MKLKKKKTSKTGKPSWLLKLHHATINKSVFFKKGGKDRKKVDEGETFLCFCARWLSCEGLAQVAVAVVVCVGLVVEVVL